MSQETGNAATDHSPHEIIITIPSVLLDESTSNNLKPVIVYLVGGKRVDPDSIPEHVRNWVMAKLRGEEKPLEIREETAKWDRIKDLIMEIVIKHHEEFTKELMSAFLPIFDNLSPPPLGP